MSIIAACQQVGTYRGAAAICGTTHKTVKRVMQRAEAGEPPPVREPRPANFEGVRALVVASVKSTSGRISAKWLSRRARAQGYAGSGRNFRRLVAQEKKAWRGDPGPGRRPAVWGRVSTWSSTGASSPRADPQSKGIVENLVGYGKKDLLRPLLLEHAPLRGSP